MFILCFALAYGLFLVVLNMSDWKPALITAAVALAVLLLLAALDLTTPLTILTVAIAAVVLLYLLLTSIFK